MKVLDLVREFKHKAHKRVLHNESPKWLTSPLYAEKFNAKWHKVYERMPNKRPPPIYYGALVAENLQARVDNELPETGVLELNNARLYGDSAWIFSKEGYLLADHSWYGRHVNEMRNVPRFLPKGRRLEGVCLTLVSDFATDSYAHFLLDSISRLDLFYKAGFRLSEIDHILCPKPPSKTAQRLFDQLGIPSSKCVWANENKGSVIHIEKLLAPTFPGTRRNYPNWLPTFLQQEFLTSPPAPSRRLYISRAGCRRNVVNEEAITRILINYDFEIYDPAQHENQPDDFAEAAVIVAPHGGGLSNLAFCQPGTKVLELIPTDHVYPYYYTLSDAAGLEYGCIIGQSTHERGQDAWGPSSYNFYVNEDEFESALARITSSS
ncbi:MAG TPA: glycosyltransferase family 61 protein [Coleofasciculaceae cyanobacterium]